MIAAHTVPTVARSVWSELYQGQITIWVEDALTEQVLRRIWHDVQIGVLVAGGKDAIGALAIQATPPSLKSRVFAVVDRDFGLDKSDDWTKPDNRWFVWPVHEFENLLLDLDVLSGLSGSRRTAETLRQGLYQRAQDDLYWLACKAVIQRVHNERNDIKFPRTVRPPSLNSIRTRKDALAVLGNEIAAPFWDGTRALLGRWDLAAIEQALDRAVMEYQSHLQSETWLATFPGKELLRYAKALLGLSPVTELDLGLQISEAWLRRPERIPPSILRLHRILRERAGMPLP